MCNFLHTKTILKKTTQQSLCTYSKIIAATYLTLTLCARLHQSAPAPVAPGWSINNPRGCEVGRFPAITGGNSDVISLLIRKKGVGESIYIYMLYVIYLNLLLSAALQRVITSAKNDLPPSHPISSILTTNHILLHILSTRMDKTVSNLVHSRHSDLSTLTSSALPPDRGSWTSCRFVSAVMYVCLQTIHHSRSHYHLCRPSHSVTNHS